MPDKKLVYVASAYTKGDPAINTHFQCRVFDTLMNDGIVFPYVPLRSHFQHVMFPRPYRDWMQYDHAIITRMDGLIRLTVNVAMPDGENYTQEDSDGADCDVALAQGLGIPVFFNYASLYEWAQAA